MIIIMKPTATREETAAVVDEVRAKGYAPNPIYGEQLTVVAVVGKHPGEFQGYFEGLDGVERCVLIDQSYKLVARAGRQSLGFKVGGDLTVGGGNLVVIAGPCSVESDEQMMACARVAKEAGATMLRGGAYKPRTSPYSFQGMGEEGLQLLAHVRDETGLKIVSEFTDARQFDNGEHEYVDMIQLGARNMQNFALLAAAGETGKPVLLKRGLAATIEDLLNAAEYIASRGTENILLCERGIRTFETATRNTLDIAAVPVLRKLTHLPICLDPSHAAGVREFIPPLAAASVAVGADALMLEIHPNPAVAKSDGSQALEFDLFRGLMKRIMSMPRWTYGEDIRIGDEEA
ncbi:MAG TPA: 3-deoxy-7-phosphoheptulonate synthase [Armatimonadetes bacterium]|nr:3-deoxy-7-phosphoheptulonate synthase [Armatimonadota bacterium]